MKKLALALVMAASLVLGAGAAVSAASADPAVSSATSAPAASAVSSATSASAAVVSAASAVSAVSAASAASAASASTASAASAASAVAVFFPAELELELEFARFWLFGFLLFLLKFLSPFVRTLHFAVTLPLTTMVRITRKSARTPDATFSSLIIIVFYGISCQPFFMEK